MPQIGVRELKNQATEVLRMVREQHVEYIVTYRGEPIAVLSPIDEKALNTVVPNRGATDELRKSWADLDALRQEIDQAWESEKSGVVLVAEQRR